MRSGDLAIRYPARLYELVCIRALQISSRVGPYHYPIDSGVAEFFDLTFIDPLVESGLQRFALLPLGGKISRNCGCASVLGVVRKDASLCNRAKTLCAHALPVLLQGASMCDEPE